MLFSMSWKFWAGAKICKYLLLDPGETWKRRLFIQILASSPRWSLEAGLIPNELLIEKVRANKRSAPTSTTAQIFGNLNFIKNSSPNHQYISSNRIWDDTLFWNYFMRLLLRSIVLDNSVHLQYWQILSKIVAGVNSHKKLRKSQYHSESVILPINNGLGSVTLSQIQINKPEFADLVALEYWIVIWWKKKVFRDV